MSTLVCYRGLPGSGKSTSAQAYLCDPTNVRVNRDDIRSSVFGGVGVLAFQEENLVTQIQRATAGAALDAGYSVIVDDTNLRPKYLREWNKFALEHGASFETREFKTPIDVCIARDSARERTVGEDVIRRMASQYMPNGSFLPYTPLEPEAVSQPEPYHNRKTLPSKVIVDIDGTMALMGDRNPYDESTVSQDKPNWPVVNLVKRLLFAGTPVVFLSGRSDACREDTDRWLRALLPGSQDHRWSLLMRKAGDQRKDAIVKREIFDREIRDKYSVEFVVDDRPSVCRMWRALGLPVFQVGDPHIEF
jgi:predicted kinase